MSRAARGVPVRGQLLVGLAVLTALLSGVGLTACGVPTSTAVVGRPAATATVRPADADPSAPPGAELSAPPGAISPPTRADTPDAALPSAAAATPVSPGQRMNSPVRGARAAGAAQAVRRYLQSADRWYAAPEAAAAAEVAAIGGARDEVRAAAEDLRANMVRQRGSVVVSRLAVYRGDTDDRLRVLACLDSSRVSLVSNNGFVIRPTVTAGRRAELHEYTVQRVGSRWAVSAHAMPSDSACGTNARVRGR